MRVANRGESRYAGPRGPEIYSNFGLLDPPRDVLTEAQRSRFGPCRTLGVLQWTDGYYKATAGFCGPKPLYDAFRWTTVGGCCQLLGSLGILIVTPLAITS